MKGKSIAVTGGTGMIGQVVVRHLVEAGADVTTLSRRGARPGNPEVAAAKADITDPRTLDFTDYDVVVHGAAFVAFGLSPEKEVLLHRTNVEGTRHVLDASVRDGVKKVLHISSVAALGATHGQPRGEDWFHERPHVFHSAYERSKFEAHGLLLAEDRIDTAAIMPSIVLGIGDSSSGRLYPAYLRRRFPVTPDHPGRLGFVHVEDVASACTAALERGTGPYVCSEADLRLPELFARFEAASGVPAPGRVLPFGALKLASKLMGVAAKVTRRRPLVNQDFVRSLAKDSQFDSTRLRTELGWKPRMDAHLAVDAERYQAS